MSGIKLQSKSIVGEQVITKITIDDEAKKFIYICKYS